jgi:hypothetical protein
MKSAKVATPRRRDSLMAPSSARFTLASSSADSTPGTTQKPSAPQNILPWAPASETLAIDCGSLSSLMMVSGTAAQPSCSATESVPLRMTQSAKASDRWAMFSAAMKASSFTPTGPAPFSLSRSVTDCGVKALLAKPESQASRALARQAGSASMANLPEFEHGSHRAVSFDINHCCIDITL